MNTTGSISKDLAAQKAKIKARNKAYWVGVPMAYRCVHHLVATCVVLVMLASLAGALWLVWVEGNMAYSSQFAQSLSAWVRIWTTICAAVVLFVLFAIANDAIMRFVGKALDQLAEKLKAAANRRK